MNSVGFATERRRKGMGTICEEKKCIYRNNKSYNHCGTCAGLYDEHLTTNKDAVANVQCSDGLSCPTVTEEMLTAAMRKGVEVGIFPKHPVDTKTYLKHWDGMKKVLETVLAT
jgi:hypothetical protein